MEKEKGELQCGNVFEWGYGCFSDIGGFICEQRNQNLNGVCAPNGQNFVIRECRYEEKKQNLIVNLPNQSTWSCNWTSRAGRRHERNRREKKKGRFSTRRKRQLRPSNSYFLFRPRIISTVSCPEVNFIFPGPYNHIGIFTFYSLKPKTNKR